MWGEQWRVYERKDVQESICQRRMEADGQTWRGRWLHTIHTGLEEQSNSSSQCWLGCRNCWKWTFFLRNYFGRNCLRWKCIELVWEQKGGGLQEIEGEGGGVCGGVDFNSRRTAGAASTLQGLQWQGSCSFQQSQQFSSSCVCVCVLHVCLSTGNENSPCCCSVKQGHSIAAKDKNARSTRSRSIQYMISVIKVTYWSACPFIKIQTLPFTPLWHDEVYDSSRDTSLFNSSSAVLREALKYNEFSCDILTGVFLTSVHEYVFLVLLQRWAQSKVPLKRFHSILTHTSSSFSTAKKGANKTEKQRESGFPSKCITKSSKY